MNGKELAEWRNRANLSMGQLARLSGVSKSAISRFESGEHSISAKNYQKLLDVMRGNEPEEQDRNVKIRWHIKQLEILIESEESE